MNLHTYIRYERYSNEYKGEWTHNKQAIIKAATMYDHDYVFSHIVKGFFPVSETHMDVQGAFVPCLICPIGVSNWSAVYIRVFNTHTSRCNRAVEYVIANRYNQLPLHNIFIPVVHDIMIDCTTPRTLQTNGRISKQYIRDLLSTTTIPEFASQHHKNIEIEDLVPILDEDALTKLSYHDLENVSKLGYACLVGYMLWVISVDPYYNEIILQHGLDKSENINEFVRIGKDISNKAKFIQNVVGIDYKVLFEIHVLINRVVTPINWEQEKDNRTNPNTVKIPLSFIRQHLRNVFAERKNKRGSVIKKTTWEDFWATRYEWAPIGAVHSQYYEDTNYFDSNYLFRNKMLALNAMPNTIPFAYFSTRKPATEAHSSIKYEWAKQRAIYGCDLTNFIMHQFAFGNCEDMFNEQYPSGSTANPAFVEARLKTVLQNATPLCLDFEDFNSQHSIDSMKAVLDAVYDVYSVEMSDEQKIAFEWCYRSLDNMWVNDSVGLKTAYKTNGTLFSGWRLTSFMNSALNGAYFEYIQRGVGKDRHCHSGDDIILGVTRHEQYQQLLLNARRQNVRLSYGKCHYGSVAEFLRVDHASNGSGQYLARALSTLTFGRIESMPALNYVSSIESHMTRHTACIMRGAQPRYIERLFTRVCERAYRELTKEHIPYQLLFEQHTVCGGISTLSTSRCTVEIRRENLKDLIRKSIVNIKDLPEHRMHGTDHYAKWLAKKFEGYRINRATLRDKLNDALVETFARVKTRYNVKQLDCKASQQRKVWRAIKGAHTNSLKYIDYGRSKIIGRVLDVLSNCQETNALAHVVRNCEEPLYVLSKII
ncbi:MAG: RNA-dependent RNA polymerase [Sanya ochthera mantis totivirus 1]|nr:MAG: RNA-dependent RNA polymerase [Sanya ochthera mantis totivirus 1]